MSTVPRKHVPGDALSWILLAGAVAWGIHSCSRSPEDSLYSQASDSAVGSSPDYYLVKVSPIAGPHRVALVFNMANDHEYCLEIAEMHMRRYPADTYICEPAQK